MDTKIETVVLSDHETKIVDMIDNNIAELYKQLFNSEIDEAELRNIVQYCKHEILIENIRFGNFELPKNKWVAINDNRIDKNSIETKEFVKEVIKVDKKSGTVIKTEVQMVKIVSGYGTRDLDPYTIVRDIYLGDDKNKLLDMIKEFDKSKSALESAKCTWESNTDSKRESKLSKEYKKSLQQFKSAEQKYFEYMNTHEDVRNMIEDVIRQYKDTAKDNHTDKLTSLKNRVSVIQTAIRENKAIQARNRLNNSKNKSKSLNELYKRLTSE